MNCSQKFFSIIVIAISIFFSLPTFAFSDDDAIKYLEEHHIISAEEVFKPNEFITRGEFVVWTLKNSGFSGKTSGHENFTDIDEKNPIFSYISTASEMGALESFGKTFQENKKITKQQAMEILFTVEGFSVIPVLETPKEWKDLPKNIRVKSLLLKAIYLGFLSPSEEGKISPNGKLTKKQASEILALTTQINLQENEDTTPVFPKFDHVTNIVDENFLYRENILDENLEEGAIRGYISMLDDPYTVYFDKKESEEFLNAVNGENVGSEKEFSGIGVSLGMNKAKSTVIMKVFPNTPAERAGLQAGDIISAIDDVNVKSETVDTISSRIQGESGSSFSLTVIRQGENKVFSLTREKISITPEKNVWASTREDILWIHINSFGDKTPQEFREILEKNVNATTQGIIIDLRGNTGGFVETALKMLGELLPEKTVAMQISSKNSTSFEKTIGKGEYSKIPLVVFQNEFSASASEIFSGAIQDTQRGKIIGRVSFGKGLAQDFIPLSDGSHIKITIEEFKTPKGKKVNGIGISPDIKIVEREDIVYFNAAKEYFKGL